MTDTDSIAARLRQTVMDWIDDLGDTTRYTEGTKDQAEYDLDRLLRYTAGKARVDALRKWREDQRRYMFADVIGQAEAELTAIIEEVTSGE